MKKIYSIISAGLVFVMVLTGCGVSEQITIQRPKDGWYGAAQQQFEVTVDDETWTAEKLQASPPEDTAQNYEINRALQKARTDAIGMTGSYRNSIQKVGLKDIFDAGSVKTIVKGLKTAMDIK